MVYGRMKTFSVFDRLYNVHNIGTHAEQIQINSHIETVVLQRMRPSRIHTEMMLLCPNKHTKERNSNLRKWVFKPRLRLKIINPRKMKLCGWSI